jgi:molybdopterin-guanine dinucleotide biosynthesis protein A
MKTAGFVLTGGQSSRMGQDKARLPLRSCLLVEDVAIAVRTAAGSVTLIGRPGAYTDLPFTCLPDLRPNCGPIAGLETALASSCGAEYNLIAGCDMPGLQSAWLQQLLLTAYDTGALCVLAQDASGNRHPLCAVYRRACLPFVRQALDQGHLRLLDLVSGLQAVAVPIDAVIANVNTPDQWAAWRALPA